MLLRKKLANHSSNRTQQYSLGLYQQWYSHFPSKIPGRWTGTMHDDAMYHMPRRWRNMKIMAMWPHGLQGFWPRIILKYIEVGVFRVASKRGKQMSGNNKTETGWWQLKPIIFFQPEIWGSFPIWLAHMFQRGWLKATSQTTLELKFEDTLGNLGDARI